MNRQYKAVRVGATDKYLSVKCYVEVGMAVRFAEVKVPWALVVEQHEAITNAIEQHFTRELNARWEQKALPLEKWE